MLKLILVLLFIVLVGCEQRAKVEEIDGCEYIIITTNGKPTAITHKGNCSNLIHEYTDTTEYIPSGGVFKTIKHVSRNR